MGIFDHSSRSAFVMSHTDVGQEGLALSLHSDSSHWSSIRTLCRPVQFIHTKVSHHVFMELLCALVQSCWNRKDHPQTVPTELGAGTVQHLLVC